MDRFQICFQREHYEPFKNAGNAYRCIKQSDPTLCSVKFNRT